MRWFRRLRVEPVPPAQSNQFPIRRDTQVQLPTTKTKLTEDELAILPESLSTLAKDLMTKFPVMLKGEDQLVLLQTVAKQQQQLIAISKALTSSMSPIQHSHYVPADWLKNCGDSLHRHYVDVGWKS